ncbi:hypothetical protein BH10PSE19_BH10PSE19_12950 [soil metagenome]
MKLKLASLALSALVATSVTTSVLAEGTIVDYSVKNGSPYVLQYSNAWEGGTGCNAKDTFTKATDIRQGQTLTFKMTQQKKLVDGCTNVGAVYLLFDATMSPWRLVGSMNVEIRRVRDSQGSGFMYTTWTSQKITGQPVAADTPYVNNPTDIVYTGPTK